MDIKDSAALLLTARFAAYRSLQVAFASEPAGEYVASVAQEGTADVFGIFSDAGGGLDELVEDWRKAAADLAFDADALDRVARAYCGLFVGPGAVGAAPWESVYRGTDRTLFQKSTLEVRRAYVAQGLIPKGYPHVADDHIALELDFMCLLARRMEEALADGEREVLTDAAEASLSFLDEHLSKWVASFREALEGSAKNEFYLEAALVLEAFIASDAAALAEVLDSIKEGLL